MNSPFNSARDPEAIIKLSEEQLTRASISDFICPNQTLSDNFVGALQFDDVFNETRAKVKPC